MAEAERRGLRPLPLLVLVSLVVVLVTVGAAQGLWLTNLHNGLLATAFTGVGGYLLWQRPGSREGVLFVATGVVEAVIFCGRQLGHASGSGNPWWPWFGVWPVVVGLALTTLSVICYPDGRLPSARWRFVVVMIVVATVLCAAMSALWPVEYASAGVDAGHPLNAEAPPAVQAVWSAVAHPTYVAFQVIWVVAVAWRWRRSDGHVREQLAWLVVAAAGSVVALVVGLVGWGTPTPGLLAAALLPVVAGWAIVRAQRAASYRALTWLSRSQAHSVGLPDDFTQAVAQAVGASKAALWAGSADDLRVTGCWPSETGTDAPVALESLTDVPDRHLRVVRRDDEVVGALSLDGTGRLSLAETRLLDDLVGQAALVLEHQSLSLAIAQQRRAGRLDVLTPREQDVLELLALGLSNGAICARLHLSVKTVEPVVSSIFSKLDLPPDSDHNRRVLAVLAYLNH